MPSPALCTEEEVHHPVHASCATVRKHGQPGPIFEAPVRDWNRHGSGRLAQVL